MFKPMLASPTDGTNLAYPLLASPKLDGIRCLIIDGVVMSRSLKPIPNRHLQQTLGLKELNGLDGELILGDPTGLDCFRKTSSAVMSLEGEPNVVFHVFDQFNRSGGFKARLSTAMETVAKCKLHTKPGTSVIWVPHHTLESEAELNLLEQQYVDQGYEGIMLRDPNGPYKHGRSTLKEGWLLKLKRFVDGEAEIIGFSEEQHNANEAMTGELGQTKRRHVKAGMVGKGTLGAFLVRDLKTGVEFSVGSGFTQADRQAFWAARNVLKGRPVKYRSQPTGVKDAPRFPVFCGFRDLIDM